jgi:sarcosine oxidase subunit gamma
MRVSAAEVVHPLAGVLKPGGDGPVRLDSPARDIVQVLARRGRAGEVDALLGQRARVWLQPGVWAVMTTRGPAGALAAALRNLVGEAAAVTDQTHGRCVIGIEGALAARVLAAFIRIDLHDSAFPVGATAVTEAAHIGIALLRAAPDRYEIICMRTFAAHIWHAVTEAAAEYGYTVA